jgi:hypothetical protein
MFLRFRGFLGGALPDELRDTGLWSSIRRRPVAIRIRRVLTVPSVGDLPRTQEDRRARRQRRVARRGSYGRVRVNGVVRAAATTHAGRSRCAHPAAPDDRPRFRRERHQRHVARRDRVVDRLRRPPVARMGSTGPCGGVRARRVRLVERRHLRAARPGHVDLRRRDDDHAPGRQRHRAGRCPPGRPPRARDRGVRPRRPLVRGAVRPAAAQERRRQPRPARPVHRRPAGNPDPADRLAHGLRVRDGELARRPRLPRRVVSRRGRRQACPDRRRRRLSGRHGRVQLLLPARRDRRDRRRDRRRPHPRGRKHGRRHHGGRVLPGDQFRARRRRGLAGVPCGLAEEAGGKPGVFPDSTNGPRP